MAGRSIARSLVASLQRVTNTATIELQQGRSLAETISQRCRLSVSASHLPTCMGATWQLPTSSPHYDLVRWASSASGNSDETKAKEETSKNDTKGSSEGADASADARPDKSEQEGEEMLAQLNEAKATEEKLHEQVNQLTDKLKRSLAEMENVRTRSAREVENAKKFGSQGIVKDLLDIPDNLERAASSVPAEALQAPASGPGSEEEEKLRKLLKGLLEGVQATEKIMLQVLRKHGVEQYNPAGDKFDPNLHSALFEVPDGTKDTGIVAVVTKRGYKLHDRVIRPADVGVTRAPR